MFGWLLLESSIAYPKVITSKEIQRKLGVAYNTALLLKRRLQLFVGLVSKEYPQNRKGSLRKSILREKSPTRSIIDISKEFKNKQYNKNNEELQRIFHLKKWSILKKECSFFDIQMENKINIPRFKRTREKVYFKLSFEIWNKVKDKKGFINLNELINFHNFHLPKAIRIIRRWNKLGIVDIIDKSKKHNNQIYYLFKVNLKANSLPYLFYMYTRTEYLTKKTTKRGRK